MKSKYIMALNCALICGCAASAYAQSPDDLFKQIASPSIEVLAAADCNVTIGKPPATLSSVMLRSSLVADPQAIAAQLKLAPQSVLPSSSSEEPEAIFSPSIFGWAPTAKAELTDPTCSADELERQLLNRKQDRFARAQFAADFFKRCDHSLTRNSPPDWLALLQLDQLDYNFCDNPRIRKVRIHLPDQRILMGWLALKMDSTPRPLVIGKCGVFCDPGGPSHRFLMMHLFDESPFNVLLIANGTGNQFVRDNKVMAFGGLDEGVDLIHLAELVNQNSPVLRQRTSSLHLAAVSLGSHSALYAGLYNFRLSNGRPLVASVTALCPVVNLKDTFDENFSRDDLKSRALAYAAWQSLLPERRFIKKLQQMITSEFVIPLPSRIPPLMVGAALEAYPQRQFSWWLPPLKALKVEDDTSFWTSNRFASYSRDVQTPVFIWASQDDPIVSPVINADRLVQQQDANTPNSPIQVVTSAQGSHCAFSTIYGWDVTSAMIRSNILSESPEFNDLPAFNSLEKGTLKMTSALEPGESYFSQNWEAQPGVDHLKVNLVIYSPHSDKWIDRLCDESNPANSVNQPRCFRTVTSSIPIRTSGLGVSVPDTETEAQVLTRWANSNLRLSGSHGEPLAQLRTMPTVIFQKTSF
jgi:hypothetical protein